MQVELVKTFYFEAAHKNESGEPKQRRLHGHSYRVDLVVAGAVTSNFGWLMDYADIKEAFSPFYGLLDHGFLNDLSGMGGALLPDVRLWILERLRERLPGLRDARVSIVGDCAFRPVVIPADRHLPERVRFSFEAAQSLPQLPETHPCRRLHGHSYRIEFASRNGGLEHLTVHAEALYELLDHTYLNEVRGLDHATSERMAEWIWNWLLNRGVEPSAVIVQETESARCVYYGY